MAESMEEPAAAWAPCAYQLPYWSTEPGNDVQLADWTMEQGAVVWVPGLPVEAVESVCTDVSVSCPQASSLSPSRGQLVKYAAATQNDLQNRGHATSVVEEVVGEFKADMGRTKVKMHRYPASLGAVDKIYTIPKIVAIGPYHHDLEDVKQAEKVKHAAACHCVKLSGRSLEELYGAVVPVADGCRSLYDKDVMAGIGYDDFRHMMFFDACFLVQYMLLRAADHRLRDKVDESLLCFLSPNIMGIFRDVMLLENQLPWKVVETVMSFMPVPSSIPKKFVAGTRLFMLPDDRHDLPQQKPLVWYDSYKPPHLLGLLRYYMVGGSDDTDEDPPKTKDMSFSISALKLAEIGIKLTANKTAELTDMSLNKGTLAPELCLPPLSLDRDRASYLANLAALEICTVKSFSRAKPRESAVCSYLRFLSMLVYSEEDVHELRRRGLLVGGGLTNDEALRFFTSFQGQRFGPYFYDIMKEIQSYRESSRIRANVHAFLHNNKKTIIGVFTAIGTGLGIITALQAIKGAI